MLCFTAELAGLVVLSGPNSYGWARRPGWSVVQAFQHGDAAPEAGGSGTPRGFDAHLHVAISWSIFGFPVPCLTSFPKTFGGPYQSVRMA